MVDYNSKLVAVENLQNTQSETVISKCKKVFSQHGIPKELTYEQRSRIFEPQISFIFKNLEHTTQNDSLSL